MLFILSKPKFNLFTLSSKINRFEILFRFWTPLNKTVINRLTNTSKQLTAKMPSKKDTSKRKNTQTLPLVKDPFSAAKKKKLNEENDDNVLEIENTATAAASIANDEPVTGNGESKKVASIFTKKNKHSKKSSEDAEDETDKTNSSSNVKYDKEEFKKASNGKDWNFKIVSWNVNGIRAWLEHGGLDYLKAEDPDIFCCQEIKCDVSKVPPKVELRNYHCYWLSGDTQGYSGVGVMSKTEPLKITYGINDPKHDEEGRVITAEYENFYLINSYIPNSGRGLVRLNYRMEWEKVMRNYLANLNKLKPIIWCGDLNVAHNEIDLKNPKTNTKTAGFTKEERECFTLLLNEGNYIDSFRYLYPKLEGQYTYWSYFRNARAANCGWRLDYFILADKLKEFLVDNVIRSKVVGSDHCPIALFLKFPKNDKESTVQVESNEDSSKNGTDDK